MMLPRLCVAGLLVILASSNAFQMSTLCSARTALLGNSAVHKPTCTPPRLRPALRMAETEAPASTDAWSPAGMTVEDFFERSIGSWRSLRSSHNIAFAQLEEVNSDIDITDVALDDPELQDICKQYEVDPATACSSIRMAWEGTSDWDEEEILNGSTVLVVVKDGDNTGKLLRSVGYTETIPAAGDWEMQADGTFVLKTLYDRAAAEERIWFATPDLRMRVSMIKTQGGKGVLTASLSTEVRDKSGK